MSLIDDNPEHRISAIVDTKVVEFVNREFALEAQDPTFVTKMLEFSEFVLKTNKETTDRVNRECALETVFKKTHPQGRPI